MAAQPPPGLQGLTMTSRFLLSAAAVLMLAGPSRPAGAQDAQGHIERQACVADVADTRARAAALPPGDLSRRFAEHYLDVAVAEMSAGEVDECPMLVERARHTIRTRPYILRPGETLDGYGPDTRG